MKSLISTVAILLACLGPYLTAPEASAKEETETPKPSVHRLDFRVEGASCVTCLRRISQTFRSCPGVFKADVSIYRPFWAIVIYDYKRTSLSKLTEAVKSEHVKLVDVEDKSISGVPAMLVPKTISGRSG
jgi:hypothetical protein